MFPGHGAGKGSKPRHKLNANWRANFDEIAFPHSNEGFIVREGKLTKRYGPAEPEKFDRAPRAKVF